MIVFGGTGFQRNWSREEKQPAEVGGRKRYSAESRSVRLLDLVGSMLMTETLRAECIVPPVQSFNFSPVCQAVRHSTLAKRPSFEVFSTVFQCSHAQPGT